MLIAKIVQVCKKVGAFLLLTLVAFSAAMADDQAPIDFGGSTAAPSAFPSPHREFTPEQARLIFSRKSLAAPDRCAAKMQLCPDGSSAPLLTSNGCQAACGFGSGNGAWAKPWQTQGQSRVNGVTSRQAGAGAQLGANTKLSMADTGNISTSITSTPTVGGVSFTANPTNTVVDNSTRNQNNVNTFTANPTFSVNTSSSSSSTASSTSGGAGGSGNGNCDKTGSALGSLFGGVGAIVGGALGSLVHKC